MTKTNKTRSALFTSIISLLLCVSMLVGTTFAWFTDSVVSGRNTIAAGNLDVELYNDDVKVDGGTVLFDDVKPGLWEPGAVAYENLQVRNVGTLALKYDLTLDVLNETVVNGYKLSDVIMVGVVDGGITSTDRTEVINSVNTWTKLSDFSLNMEGVKLAAKTNSPEFGIVLYWQPNSNEIDNRYNMNNENQGKELKLDIGVTLFASQQVEESDSFGPDYDEDALYADVIVSTDAELLAAIQNPEVKVIAISGDLTYNWGTQSYENSQALLMKGKTFVGNTGTSDSITFAGYGSANPITDVTLKDITVADETVGDDEGSWEHGHLEFVSLTAKNVVFANSIMLAGDSTLTNCSMDNQIASWYGVWIEGGNTVIENCTFTGTRAVKIHENYGTEVTSVLVDNCDFVLTEKPGVVIGDLNSATAVTIQNSTFNTQAGDQKKYVYETDTDVATFDFSETNNVIITTDEVDSLKAMLAAAKSGDTVEFSLNYDAYVDGWIFVPEGVTLELNGNGHTIIANTPNGNGVFYAKNANFQIEDVTITGSATYAIYSNGVTWEGGNTGASLTNVTINMSTPSSSYPVTFGGKGDIALNNCTITGAGRSMEGNYRNGTHIFAGAEINLTVNGGNVGNVLMNANYAGNSTLTLNDGAVVEKLILAGEQTRSATLTNNGGTVNEVYKQVDNASMLKSVLESANAGETVVANKDIDLNGETVAVANGVKLMSEGTVTISNAHFTVADDQSASFADLKFAGKTTIEAKGDGALNITNCEFNVTPDKYNGFSRAAAIIGANQYHTLDLNVEGCTFNYQYASGDADLWNAAIFMWSNVDDCVIKNCTFNGYGFMAVKLMNVAEGAEIVFEDNTFNMCEANATNYYNNNAVSIQPQHDNTFSVECTNNTFTGAYEKDGDVFYIVGMSGLTLTKCTLTHSGNTVNGVAATDANFEVQ